MWTIANDRDPNSTKEENIRTSASLIYPNPFQNNISFKESVLNVSVYNMMGNVVYRTQNGKEVLLVDNLDWVASGVYLVEFYVEGRRMTELVVRI